MTACEESIDQLKTQIQVDGVYSVQRRAEVAAVLKAYSDLSVAGRAELIRQLNRFNSSDYAQRLAATDSMNEILHRVGDLHRPGSGCPCCGYKSD